MLEELDIKNFALIDSAHVEFGRGFTVLSGETGAGKSILIGSLAFLLGGKAGVEQIRTGTHEAQVSGSFLLESQEALEWLSEHGIEAEDSRILLRRLIRDNGKSSAWIGGVPVTRADLLAFCAFLVDIHGQHEQQSLMKVSEHRRYLDMYADIVPQVQAFTSLYSDLVEKRRALDALDTDESQREAKIEMLNFAINEIQEAKLKNREDEELEAEENRLSSYEKLYGTVNEINGLFDGAEGSGLISVMRRLKGLVPHASSMDKTLESLDSRFESSFYELEDIASEFKHYEQSLVFDPDRLSQVQDRLELINKLKKKYVQSANASVADILSYQEKASQELECLTGAGHDRETLCRAVSEAEKAVYQEAKKLSALRKAASEKMSAAIEGVLVKLGMKDTKFCVHLEEKAGDDMTQKCGPYGLDDIEFLISSNPGSPMLPLARIASGGELSRVMLALKTILSDADLAGTLVFDEIDTGIGGEVAVALGNHMKLLAAKKQILCITHLASIAVYADNQIKIQKGVDASSTSTTVFPVAGDERVKEIARMLSGDSSSQASLEHAASMLRKFGGM
ncbi:MAG: DNA repair protein RecN [Treponema sp.]|nr:DNA repair protein RecN [Treponema sp.]